MSTNYTIIGSKGFIGSALAKKIGAYTTTPTEDTDVLIYMGSTVHPEFEKNFDCHFNKIVSDFLYLLPFCKQHGIFFIYPSSALVYEKETPFVKSKKIIEMMASCYPNTLGLRIFPTYGPGEQRTIISTWCRAAKEGKTISIYGDGNQSRDFIYIDDVVDIILDHVQKKTEGVIDVGAGQLTKFNEIANIIKEVSGNTAPIEYLPAPSNYVTGEGVLCKNPSHIRVPIRDGIKKIFESL
jgi:nucleoside-diphosphate-sugar epimerase